jgi:periplasmic protein CpxP/Spy
MNTLPKVKQLILVASLALACPLGALADSAPAAAPDHFAGGPAYGHEMSGCMMGYGPAHGGMFRSEEMFGEGGALPPMLEHLQLNEAQQDKIFAIMHAQAPQAHELGKAIRNAHRGLHELVTGASYDDAKAKALTDALGKAVAESALLHARTHHQIFEVLTPEQRESLERCTDRGPGGGRGPCHQDGRPPMPPR